MSHIIRAGEGHAVAFMGFGARYLVRGEDTDGRFAVVEHPIAPRTLAPPVHKHAREDEYSFVLEGRIGVLIGGEEHEATVGDLVVKPRGVPHAFWNPADEPARVLETISPAGFERYFEEIAPLLPGAGPPDETALGAVMARYELAMDLSSVPALVERHGLRAG